MGSVVLSVAGLESIIARGLAPNPEVFLIANDTVPPVSNQWSLGARQNFRGMVTSVTYTGMRSRNLFTFIRGNRRADGTCCLPVPGFSNILISDAEGRKAWYDGLYVQVDRPYGVGGTKYGFSVTYTLGTAEQTGGDLFSLDFPTVADYPRYPTGGDERHRLVLTGIVRLPYDFLASTFITLGIWHALYHRRPVTRRRCERASVPSATRAARSSSPSSSPTRGPTARWICRWKRPSGS